MKPEELRYIYQIIFYKCKSMQQNVYKKFYSSHSFSALDRFIKLKKLFTHINFKGF